jgi:drug/metabolite transporter (DMT)-like permease
MRTKSLHRLGVACGLAAGAWMGAAEVPTRLVSSGYSPFLISLGMVAGVFLGRWTLPMALKGGAYLILDIRRKPHLIVWAILAGVLWAVANTLTVFAIRNVGLSIAFPLWNTNSLVGLLWGWLFFGELRAAGAKQWTKVMGGAISIVAGTCLLAYASTQSAGGAHVAAVGVGAALGAGLLWGTMYIPYRKAYISGMNPLSFVTVFTFGELGAVLFLTLALDGGASHLAAALHQARPALFWLLLGGFCWVVGDLFQQYAAKYIGIGRGIPLSNTNQLWGLAWGVLVFGETAGAGAAVRWWIIGGSILMVAGAAAVSFGDAPEEEQAAWKRAMERESRRYGLDLSRLEASLEGHEEHDLPDQPRRSAWDWLAAAIAAAVFLRAAFLAKSQPVRLNLAWTVVLSAATILILIAGGWLLWRRTRFS